MNGWREAPVIPHTLPPFPHPAVSHHGLPSSVRDAAFDAMQRLFALPVSDKMTLRCGADQRGYVPFASELLDPRHQKHNDTKGAAFILRHGTMPAPAGDGDGWRLQLPRRT